MYLDELQDIHLVYEAVGDSKGQDISYLPGCDTNQLTVGMLLRKLDFVVSEAFNVDREQYSDSWETLMEARKEYMRQNNQILLKDLLK